MHCTHCPWPLHIVPPLSVHGAPGDAGTLAQVPLLQVRIWQAVPGSGQSEAWLHWVQVPLTQALPGSQVVAQSPQWLGFVWRSKHLPEHFL